MYSFTRIQHVFVSVMLASFSDALDERSVSVALNGPLKNLCIFNEKLYIGGTNMMYVLNKDLSINQSANTCNRSTILCGNVNQVLLVNDKRKELLVCGTGKGGICEVRSTENIRIVLRKNTWIHAPMKVSTDRSRPAQGVLTRDGSVTLAVTFGKGLAVSTSNFGYLTYEYAISTRSFIDFEPLSTQLGTKVRMTDIKSSSLHDYIIYYKAGFQYNWYTYFVTNQKKYVGHTKYLSKLVRICQNDTDFKSYTDIVINCLHNGTEYNLIQEAVILEAPDSVAFAGSDRVFVGVFTRGNDPTKPSGDSVFCVSKLKDLDNEILQAKKIHAFSCKVQDLSERYLPNLRSTSNCVSEKDYIFSCENPYPTFFYVIGNITFSMTSRYLLHAEKGSVTALNGARNAKGNIVIIAGTSTGHIAQMMMESLESPLQVFSTANVRKSIKRVHIQDDDTIYVMSSKNVFLFSRSNCSEYTTCSDTMTGRNPLCGWCVYKQRATRQSNCSDEPNHWLSSIRDCISRMHVTPSNIPVNVSSNTNVTLTLTLENLPKPRTEDVYQCRLINEIPSIGTDIQAERNGSVFSCTLPFVKEHVEATLALSVQTASNEHIVLSKSNILFFECARLNRCRDCIGRSKQHCDWCTDEAMCLPHGSPCTADLRSSEDTCPQLLDTRGQHFVHAGVLTTVPFRGIHIPASITANQYTYTCKMPSGAVSSTAAAFNNSIFCSVNLQQSPDQPKQDQKIRIYYGARGQKASDIDDEFANFVTVYNCTRLAKDCSHCRALNKTRYNCEWCANKNLCEYRFENHTTATCPAPTISMMVPRDGPVTGHTKITVYGSNLGSNLSDIDSVQIADIPCKLSDDVTQFLVTDYGDFETSVPNRLVCYTGSTVNETTGALNVTVNGKTTITTDTYSYRIPAVGDIVPKYGPKAGGTRVTIYGENLGIGNRHIGLLLGGKHCLKPEVRPDIPRETVFLGTFTIVCTVAGEYSGNITTVTLSIDGKTVVSEASASFRFVTDPTLHPISPKKAFLSGGTQISVEGMQLDNAHDARITLSYGHVTEIGDCIIQSESSAICKAPRAPQSLKEELLNMENTSKLSEYIKVTSILHLDNIRENVEISYYQDPSIDNLRADNSVVQIEEDDRHLRIKGNRLNKVATLFDINITVGVEPCVLVKLTSSYITCIAPKTQPECGISHAEYPEVNVTIGNIHKMIGYVQYKGSTDWISSPVVLLSAAGIAAVLILIISIATILICRQYRRMKSRLRHLVKQNSLNENSDIIRLNRMAPTFDCYDKRMEYSDLYSDIRESGVVDTYNTLTTDDQVSQHSLAEHLRDTSQHPLAEHLQDDSLRSHDSLRAKNKITVEIQLEGATATDVTLVPKMADDRSYLHAVNYGVGTMERK